MVIGQTLRPDESDPDSNDGQDRQVVECAGLTRDDVGLRAHVRGRGLR